MKRPSFQFYPADWRKDAALQSCSIAAQGLWVNMLCIAHECEPYGHLTINGKAMSAAQIGRLVGLGGKDSELLLRELADAGVSATSEAGIIYSRRMVRDEATREKRAKGGYLGADHGDKGGGHGAKGGRPKLSTRPVIDDVEGGINNPPSEARSANKEPPNKPPPSSSSSSSSVLTQTEDTTQRSACVSEFVATALGSAYAALRDAGITDADPGNPVLKVLMQQGVEVPELLAAAQIALKAKRSDMAFVVGIVRNRRADAEKLRLAPLAAPANPLTATVGSADSAKTLQRLAAESRREVAPPSDERRAALAAARNAAARH